MRPFTSALLTTSILVSISQVTLATPQVIIPPSQHDERSLDDLFGGAAANISGDISDLLTDAASLLQSFITVLEDLHNATNENDLVDLLGLDVQDAEDDDAEDDDAEDNDASSAVTNETVGAVSANATCPGMAVLFARGTGEPGNVGLYTGPSFFTALRNYVNGSTSVAFQGIPYPASIPGFLAGGSPFGSAVMATLANKTAAACPNTKLVMSGYSQGAQVVHNAMTLLSNGTLAGYTNTTTTTTTTTATAVDSRVASVVLFGDPLNGTAVSGVQSGRVLSLCNAQDDICAQHGDVVTLDHLTYSQNAAQAAMFVMQKSALGMASDDAQNQGMGNVPTVKTTDAVNGGMQIGNGASLPVTGFFELGRGRLKERTSLE